MKLSVITRLVTLLLCLSRLAQADDHPGDHDNGRGNDHKPSQKGVVESLNGLTGNVTLSGGSGVTITPVGNGLTIASQTAAPTSINGLTGQVTLAAGPGITITSAGSNLTIGAQIIVPAGAWNTTGNTANSGDFLGTLNNTPLELKVNGQRALRIEPGLTPNLIAGAASNNVSDPVLKGATISGGGTADNPNSVTSDFGTIAGGEGNTAAYHSFIGAGAGNRADYYGAIGGGFNNTCLGQFTTVSGGWGNDAEGDLCSVAGGAFNFAQGPYNTIGGGSNNVAFPIGGTIAGGLQNLCGRFASIGGGAQNDAGNDYSTIAGGQGNRATGGWAAAGGGADNESGGNFAFIGGGANNQTARSFASICGGFLNTNSAEAGVIGGGIQNFCSGAYATVAGGAGNRAQGRTSIVAGGYQNEASGDASFAAGTFAEARDPGSFIWGDTSGFATASTTSNQFVVRATGGVQFISGNPNFGVQLPAGSGAWSSLSDRECKANFRVINPREILERLSTVQIQEWNYKTQDASVHHLGPTAQDFHAAFGLGEDDRHISNVDADGVALAAIKGLNQKLEAQAAIVKAKDVEIRDLKARLERLEQMVNVKNGG